MSQLCDNLVSLVANPILTVLGRRGRGALVAALRADPARVWTVRALGRDAGLPAAVAARGVKELVLLGAVESLRPGRDAAVRFLLDSVAGRFLATIQVPDLASHACKVFADAYHTPVGTPILVRWHHPDDVPDAPETPVRIAVRIHDGEDEALDAVGPALDAVRQAGLPLPEVGVFEETALEGDDPVAAAVRTGTPLGQTR